MLDEQQFFTNLRRSTGRTQPPPADLLASRKRPERPSSPRSQEECAARLKTLCDNARPLNLEVATVDSPQGIADYIKDIATRRTPEFNQQMAIACHVHPLLQAVPLNEALAGTGIPVHRTEGSFEQLRHQVLASSIGITVAEWGVAESATIVQRSGPGCPRTTSLIPSIHIAVLEQARLLANLTEVYAMLGQEQELGTVVFISGPSKTADIESIMVHGAHGPREMHLLILTEQVQG